MFGTLVVWGTDSDGFWKQRIPCYQSEVVRYLALVGDYDDYDFEF